MDAKSQAAGRFGLSRNELYAWRWSRNGPCPVAGAKCCGGSWFALACRGISLRD